MLFWDIHNIQIVFLNTTRNSWLSTNEGLVEKGHSVQACLFLGILKDCASLVPVQETGRAKLTPDLRENSVLLIS